MEVSEPKTTAPQPSRNEISDIPKARKYAAFAAMCVVVLTEALDATSIAVVLPIIAQSLNAGTVITFSLATSFLLASTVFQPVFSSLSHVFGRKPVLLVALALFLAGALVGALAKSIEVLLAGRILQGVGAAGTIALTVLVVTDLVPLHKRPPFYAVLNAMWAVGSVTGPVIGGAFAGSNWRWIFWINVPLVVTSSTAIVLFLPGSTTEESIRIKLGRIHYVGLLLFLVSGTAFLIPITLAGTLEPWSSWRMLLPLLLGAAGLIAFVIHQTLVSSHRVFNFSIFANRTVAIGDATIFLHGMLLWLLLYYLPLYYEGILGYSALKSGLAAFPETLTVAPAAIGTGLLIGKFGSYRWAITAGWCLATLGVGLLRLLDDNSPVVEWVFINILPGLGLGMLVPACGTAVQAACAKDDETTSISIFYLLRAAGQAVGVAVGGAVFRSQLTAVKGIDSNITADRLLEQLRTLPHNNETREAVIRVIEGALRAVWTSGCAIAAVALLASFWMKGYVLRK